MRIVEEYHQGALRFKVAGHYVNGRRKRRYFATEDEAKTFIDGENIKRVNLGARAQRIDGALAEDAIRAADLLRGVGLTVYDAARLAADSLAKLSPFGATTSEAVEFFVRARQIQQRSTTLGQLVTEFLANRKAKGKSHVYLYDLEKRLNRFVLDLGAARMICDLQAKEIDTWIHGLGLGPQSMNNFRAAVSAMCSFAVKRDYLAENIIQRVDKVKVIRDSIAIFTAKEVACLLKVAAPELVPYLAIGVFAGLRPEEIKRLRWSDVSLEDRLITVNATISKTARKRFAEITDNLYRWLLPYANLTGLVVCRNLQKLMRAARAKAGIKTWPPDVLRHTYASAHYAHFKNPAHTALLLGHRDQTMLMLHYRNLMKPAEAARYWEIVPRRRSKKIIPMIPQTNRI